MVRQRRFAGLDGLRALAVIAVVVFHADPALLPGGFLGVDLFFVISGYLITRLLLAELGHTGRLGLVRFYLRRLLRLMPALLVLLVAVAVGGSLIWRDELFTLRASVLSSLGYASNWWLIEAHQSYFVASGRPPMLQHLWSLAIEEQFYLLWPVLLIAMSSRRRRFGWVAVAAGTAAAVSTATMAVLAIRSGVPFAADSSRVYFGTDTHSMGLLLGAAMGAVAERLDFQVRRTWRIRPWATDLVAMAALIAFAGVLWRIDEFSAGLYRGGFAGASVLAVLVVSTVTRPKSLVGRVLDWGPLRWIGDRSYAIYLWHWPVVVVTRPGVDLPPTRWLADLVRLGLPLILAALSYAYLERPMRKAGAAWLDARSERAAARLKVPGGRSPIGVARPRLIGAVRPRLVGLSLLALGLLTLLASPSPRPRQPGALSSAEAPRITASAEAAVRAAGPSGLGSGSFATFGPAPKPAAGGDRTLVPAVPPSTTAAKPSGGPAGGPANKPAGKPGQTPTGRPPASAPAEPSITAFGDSVMLGAQPVINATFPHSDVRAVEGRQPYVTLQDVRTLQSSGRLCSVVVIHTGNNGIIRASDLADTLTALRDRQQVILLTDRVPMDWQGPNNATIKRVAGGFGNVAVLDWFARSNRNQDWFYADGLHLRPPGASEYVGLLASVVRRPQ
ncbi:MAG: peptidoglycan-N-acetylmuramate O-acetyltransferase [Frankiales bacterium]|nr:peptidoglycan-N-acetylmuramate O-acetyltransferase [Frankiales bacterium]